MPRDHYSYFPKAFGTFRNSTFGSRCSRDRLLEKQSRQFRLIPANLARLINSSIAAIEGSRTFPGRRTGKSGLASLARATVNVNAYSSERSLATHIASCVVPRLTGVAMHRSHTPPRVTVTKRTVTHLRVVHRPRVCSSARYTHVALSVWDKTKKAARTRPLESKSSKISKRFLCMRERRARS